MFDETALRRDFDFGRVRFMNFINLENEQHQEVLGWRNSDEIRKWFFTDHPISIDEHRAFINRLRTDNRYFSWMAVIDGVPSGVVNLQRIDSARGIADLGIYSVRKGCGRLMLTWLMRLWFDTLKMNTLRSEFIEGNVRAERLYESAGFVRDNEEPRLIERSSGTARVISMSIGREAWQSLARTG